MVVEGKIVEALTGAGVGDAEEVLTGASHRGVGDTDDDANGAGAAGVAAGGGPVGEVRVRARDFRDFLPKSDSSSRLI